MKPFNIQISIMNSIARLALLLIHELEGFLPRHHIDRTGFLPETNTVAFLSDVQHLGSESSANELPVGGVGDGLKHLGHGGTVLRVQIGVNLVK